MLACDCFAGHVNTRLLCGGIIVHTVAVAANDEATVAGIMTHAELFCSCYIQSFMVAGFALHLQVCGAVAILHCCVVL
jgi:hypothetical protein